MVKTVNIIRKYSDGTKEIVPVKVEISNNRVQMRSITKSPYISEVKAILEYFIDINKVSNQEIRNKLIMKQGSSGCQTWYITAEDGSQNMVLHISMYGKTNKDVDTQIDILAEILKQIDIEPTNVEIIE